MEDDTLELPVVGREKAKDSSKRNWYGTAIVFTLAAAVGLSMIPVLVFDSMEFEIKARIVIGIFIAAIAVILFVLPLIFMKTAGGRIKAMIVTIVILLCLLSFCASMMRVYNSIASLFH